MILDDLSRTSLVLGKDFHDLVHQLDRRAALALRLAHDVGVASFVGLDYSISEQLFWFARVLQLLPRQQAVSSCHAALHTYSGSSRSS